MSQKTDPGSGHGVPARSEKFQGPRAVERTEPLDQTRPVPVRGGLPRNNKDSFSEIRHNVCDVRGRKSGQVEA